MNVIPPIEITTTVFTSSGIPMPDASQGESLWLAATNYVLGQIVVRPSVGTAAPLAFENQIAGVDAGLPEATPNRWLPIGVANKWRMVDTKRSKPTIGGSSLTTVFTPGKRINSVAVRNMKATSVTIEMRVGGILKYTITKNLNYRITTTATQYCFGTFRLKPNIVQFNLPPYTGAELTFIFTNTSGNVEVGAVVMGTYINIGDVEYSATNDVLNFSKILRNPDTGEVELIPKPNVPKTGQVLWLNKEYVNKVIELRDDLNAKPAIWAGLPDDTDPYFDSLFRLGVYKEFSFNLADYSQARISLQIEEV